MKNHIVQSSLIYEVISMIVMARENEEKKVLEKALRLALWARSG